VVPVENTDLGRPAFGDDGVSFDTAATMVIAGEQELAMGCVIREPNLMPCQEPVGMMADIEISEVIAWRR
jgi:glutamine amidotransferase PdxT